MTKGLFTMEDVQLINTEVHAERNADVAGVNDWLRHLGYGIMNIGVGGLAASAAGAAL